MDKVNRTNKLAELSRSAFVALLESAGNPDFGQYAPISPKSIIVGNTISELVGKAIQYQNDWDLGGGNWVAPIILHPSLGGVGHISYNGRVWLGTDTTWRDARGKMPDEMSEHLLTLSPEQFMKEVKQ